MISNLDATIRLTYDNYANYIYLKVLNNKTDLIVGIPHVDTIKHITNNCSCFWRGSNFDIKPT